MAQSSFPIYTLHSVNEQEQLSTDRFTWDQAGLGPIGIGAPGSARGPRAGRRTATYLTLCMSSMHTVRQRTSSLAKVNQGLHQLETVCALSLPSAPLLSESQQNLVSVINGNTVWSNFNLSQDYGNRARSTDVMMHQTPCKR